MKTLNKVLGVGALPEHRLDDAFETYWPRLEKSLKQLPAEQHIAPVKRSSEEILDEVLSLVRQSARQTGVQAWPSAVVPRTYATVALRDLMGVPDTFFLDKNQMDLESEVDSDSNEKQEDHPKDK